VISGVRLASFGLCSKTGVPSWYPTRNCTGASVNSKPTSTPNVGSPPLFRSSPLSFWLWSCSGFCNLGSC